MRKSLEVLLSGAIDYAGLFPPAQLDMATSLANYVRYANGPEGWIMNRFVCPTARLAELKGFCDAQKPDIVLCVSAVGKASSDEASWEESLEHDASVMTEFNEQLEGCASIEAYEIRVPNHANISKFSRDLKGFQEAEVYVELPWGEEMHESIAALAAADWLAAKARTGGTSPEAFPTSDQVSLFLHECLSTDLPFKLTAGLHHPFPSVDAATGARMHGFLNVLTAACLIYSEDVSRTQAAAILSEEDRAAFAFDDDALAWRGHRADLVDIQEVRSLFAGFGSCSIEEPLQDLAYEGL